MVTLPKQLVFSCEAGAFTIYDSSEAKSYLRNGQGTAFVALHVGKGNIFETTPLRVMRHTLSAVSVLCQDGSMVHLDFDDETAHKETPQGKFRYRGDLEEGNNGRGYMKE